MTGKYVFERAAKRQFLPEILISIKQEWEKSKASITKLPKGSMGPQKNYTLFSLLHFPQMAEQPQLVRLGLTGVAQDAIST